jgi:hypothetical protein
MNAKWKILNAFSAFRNDNNEPCTVLVVFPIGNPGYFGDPYDLLLDPEELEFWQKHIGETFTIDGDPDLSKLSSKQLAKLFKAKDKVEFT